MESGTSPAAEEVCVDIDNIEDIERAEEETDGIDPVTLLTAPDGRDRAGESLEVYQVWGDSILDGRAYRSDASIRIGPGTAPRWTFLGIDMGTLPSPLASLVSLAPLWSEVSWSQRHDFQLPEGAEEGWELFGHDEGGFFARIPAGWSGRAYKDGRWWPVSEVGTPQSEDGEELVVVRFAGVERMVLEHGSFVFVAAPAQRGPRVEVRGVRELEPVFLAGLAVSAVMFLTLFLLTYLQGTPSVVLAPEREDRTVELAMRPPEAPQRAQARAEQTSSDRGQQRQDRPDRPQERGARESGLFTALDNPEIAAVLGGPGLSQSLSDGVSALIGASGAQLGGHGLAGRGDGLRCAPGDTCGYEGGGWDGPARPGGPGLAGDGGGGKVEGILERPPSGPLVMGGLNKSEIDEVIKHQEAALRYCYQRELQKDPSLSGKVVVKFTIAKDGTVSQASVPSSSLSSDAVSSCLVGRFLRMKFPEPRGAGVVIVSYPFMFSSR
jgi:hypothetical protein